jgi:hypothetical protein
MLRSLGAEGKTPHHAWRGRSFQTMLNLVMQVEQLLETYFMNLDNTWNRLQTLAEYVDDTEDYIKFDVWPS